VYAYFTYAATASKITEWRH